MSDQIIHPVQFGTAESPFDRIKRIREDGLEYWSSRDLMEVLEYPTWQHFKPVIDRAMESAREQGLQVDELFKVIREKSAGRPREDVLVVRRAAYLIAMNGDPRKPRVSEAQNYFVISTREAELGRASNATLELTEDEIVHQALQIQGRKIRELTELAEQEKARRVELEPAAEAWHDVVGATGSMSFRDAAKTLHDHDVIKIGGNKLIEKCLAWGWLYRPQTVDGTKTPAPRAKQPKLDQGVFVEKASTYTDRWTGEKKISSAPQVRVTGKGIDVIRKRLIEESGEAA